jgi:hypothetical protein
MKSFAVALLLAMVDPEYEELLRLREQIRILETRLFEEMRRIPQQYVAADEEKVLRGVADAAGLSVKIATARPERIDVSGRGAIATIASYLALLERRNTRVRDLESFRLDNDPSGEARFTMRFAFPTFTPADASATSGRPVEQMRKTLEIREGDLKKVRSLVQRTDDGRHRDVAALLEGLPASDAIHVVSVQAEERLSLIGVVVGRGPRSELKNALERSGFGGSEMKIADRAACRPFVASVVRGEGKRMSVAERPAKEFDKGLLALCGRSAGKSLGAVSARGKDGAVDLHLRNADAATVFMALHELTGENFVVDTDVKGTMDVKMTRATPAAAFEAFRSVGLTIGSGPLRRVSRSSGGRAAAKAQTWEGEPLSFSFHDAAFADIFCLFQEITSLDIYAPPLDDRVTIFAKELPWDRLMAELIASAGLEYSIDGTRLYVGPREKTAKVCETAMKPPSNPLTSLRLRLAELAAADLDIIGYSGGTAYAYAPWHYPVTLTPGTELSDGKVVSVDAVGVTFDDSGRKFVIPFDEVARPELVGAWECLSGPCIDPEIEFGIEDKVLVFRSWLHHRPSALGTWALDGSAVTVRCCGGSENVYAIVRVGKNELVLREEGEKEAARYRRVSGE